MQAKQGRIYAIDMLRASMMLLGLVIHCGITYGARNYGDAWILKDPHNTNVLFDVIVGFIHTFRMPVFFVVSGFLAAMLFIERGPGPMISNRLKRVILPFSLGLLILYPAVGIAFNYFNLVVAGSTSTNSAAISKFFKEFAWANLTTVHLWFLYYLAMFCILGWAVSLASQKFLSKLNLSIRSLFAAMFSTKLAPVLFALVTYLLLCLEGHDYIDTPLAFAVDPKVFLIYAYFFGFGWLLYHHKENLNRFKKGDSLFLAAGFVLFFVQATIDIKYPEMEANKMVYALAAMDAITVWLLTFGMIGMFLRFFNKYSARARYISDASYWIYLIHLPTAVYFQSILIPVDLNPFIKFLIVISATLVVTLVTYNFLVRNTFIGKFLNGRKYRRGLPKPEAAPTVTLSV